jgi:hypothetical protein
MKINRPATISFVLADDLKKGDRHQPPGTRDEGIARFVPVQVVLPADNVEEVALAERQFLRVPGFWLVVVESFDHLDVKKGTRGQYQLPRIANATGMRGSNLKGGGDEK